MDIQPHEWINARQAFRPTSKPRVQNKIDVEVSKAVGFTVGVNNPDVIKKVAEWRRQNPNDTQINNNYLKDPKKVEELKQALRHV